MNDPHVKSMRFRLQTVKDVEYQERCRLTHETDICFLTLEKGMLKIDFKEHYESIKDARNAIQPIIKAWEIDSAIKRGRGELEFLYLDSELIDRNPPSIGGVEILCPSVTATACALEISVKTSRSSYPDIPLDFKVSSDVENLWNRYKLYLDGKDTLLNTANFILTFLEGQKSQGEQRKKVAQTYFIELKVLRKLGELVSTRGDFMSARKGGHNLIPLTNREKLWVEACSKRIIRRVGEYAHNPHLLSVIRLGDLPPL